MKWLIEVSYRANFIDALGNTIKKNIEDLDIAGVRNVKTSQVYEIEGKVTEKKLKLLCEELLTDKITQQYKINSSCAMRHASAPYTTHNTQLTTHNVFFIVQVWYKKGVTDTVADTVKKGADDLGISGINTVKTGHEYTITGNISRKQIEKICKGLLSNKVVQEYIVK
jgi:phosphoribosylformylglycinamidine (FGAM) synthase PurS component